METEHRERGDGPSAKRRKVVERDEQEKETLLTSLSELSDAINQVVDEARAQYNCTKEVEKFVNAAGPNLGVRKLWSHVANYVECLQANGVKTYKELEDLWKNHYGKTEVRDVVERLLEAEDYHEVFLKEVERRFVEAQDALGAVEAVTVGDCIMGGLKVTDAQSVEVRELRTYWENSKAISKQGHCFQELGCQVIMVALSHVESAITWAKRCGFDFPLVVDTDKTVFRYLGLRRSVLAVWNTPSLVKYAEQLTAGTELLRPLPGDDIHQLGGDFMVDTRGQLLYVHRGKTSYDRPSVSQLLAQLRELK